QHLVELAQEAGDVGFFDRVLATDTVTMTSGLARLFGLDRRAVETSWVGWLARVHPDDAPVIEATLAQAWAEQAQQVVFKFRTAGQAEERWLSSRTVMLYSTEGTPLRLIG
ncbi:PAS domain-containing protein, partial [Escherichia coli]|nr:PAS domain-containing protein [Escherichia coli]